jgi:hypothetical protein
VQAFEENNKAGHVLHAVLQRNFVARCSIPKSRSLDVAVTRAPTAIQSYIVTCAFVFKRNVWWRLSRPVQDKGDSDSGGLTRSITLYN